MLVNLVAMAWMAGSMNLQSTHHDAEKIDHKQFGSVLDGWLLGKILDFGFGEDWKNRERREKKMVELQKKKCRRKKS
jgi:hypothetical protein